MERKDIVDERRARAFADELEVIDDAEPLEELVIDLEVTGGGIRLAVGGIDHIHRRAVSVDVAFHTEVADHEHRVGYSSVEINEICTKNIIFKDSYGNYSDWIELFNSGEKKLDISGYGYLMILIIYLNL